ncbi:response regulator [Timonella sp. A28]|uniref:response regulator n=1 Tax=Timonella sp. A28 TaxID=3442640 RepID=UPI003EB87F37
MSQPSEQQIRILLVDDDALVRAGLRLILGGHPEITVIGEAGTGSDGVAQYEQLHPDVVLMDIRMPEMDGLSATAHILRRNPQANVIVLTTFDSDEFIVKALRAGARGFLLKDTSPEELIRSVKLAASGQPTLSPTVTAQLVAKITQTPDDSAQRTALKSLELLTERELEVAQAIAQGLSNSEIAQALYMSVPTVKTHISRIFTKFEVDNRVQIAIRMHDAGRTA